MHGSNGTGRQGAGGDSTSLRAKKTKVISFAKLTNPRLAHDSSTKKKGLLPNLVFTLSSHRTKWFLCYDVPGGPGRNPL